MFGGAQRQRAGTSPARVLEMLSNVFVRPTYTTRASWAFRSGFASVIKPRIAFKPGPRASALTSQSRNGGSYHICHSRGRSAQGTVFGTAPISFAPGDVKRMRRDGAFAPASQPLGRRNARPLLQIGLFRRRGPAPVYEQAVVSPKSKRNGPIRLVASGDAREGRLGQGDSTRTSISCRGPFPRAPRWRPPLRAGAHKWLKVAGAGKLSATNQLSRTAIGSGLQRRSRP